MTPSDDALAQVLAELVELRKTEPVYTETPRWRLWRARYNDAFARAGELLAAYRVGEGAESEVEDYEEYGVASVELERDREHVAPCASEYEARNELEYLSNRDDHEGAVWGRHRLMVRNVREVVTRTPWTPVEPENEES
ncbi:MAG TPA: hypothetical protein VJS20_08785 [Gemmatimonadales bacterium]|nr:hypothetical protein [Gemmatimonadales bacterium]